MAAGYHPATGRLLLDGDAITGSVTQRESHVVLRQTFASHGLRAYYLRSYHR
jgi:hypothetical protein